MILLSVVFVIAQATSGRLNGTVSGPDGVLPNATVKVKDNKTGKEITATTKEDGSFLFPQLEFGSYTVTITVNGFKTYISNDVKIDVGRESTLSAALEIGSVQETVTITAGTDVVNSTNAELGNTVSARQVQELPLNGRNPLALLSTIAGANATSSSINGQRSSSVNFTRDGINVQDNFIRSGGFVQDRPSVDDTGEFTVTTQNAGAEQGGGGSTQVQLVTPRGGSEFHGAGFIFNRNAAFSSNQFFSNRDGLARPFLNRNQFGGKISGPSILPNFGEGGPMFLRNKAFFFFAYEGFRLRQQTPLARNILLPEARNGTFTYTATDGTTQTVNVLTGTGLTSPITALAVSPVIQSRILSNLPTVGNGNSTGINLTRVLNFNQSDNDDRERVTGRFDVEPNDRNNINFVYSYNINDDERQVDAGGFGTNPFVTQGGPTTLYSGAWSSVLSSNFTNELRIGYQRSEPFFNQGAIASDFIIGGLPLISNPTPTFRDQGRNTDFFTIQDNLTYTTGNHSFRFGGSFNAVKVQTINAAGAGVPTYNITTTNNPNTPALLGGLFPGGISTTDLGRANQLRYLLGGVVGNATLTANLVDANTGYVLGAPAIANLHFDNYSGYFSDQWRVNSQLTLNLGVRYEYFTPLRNPERIYYEPVIANGADPVAAILNPNGTYQVVGGNAGKPGEFYKSDYNNFGPIFSFAYSPRFSEGNFLGKILGNDGKSVIRGGFRMGFINDEYVQSTNNAGGGNQGAGAVAITQANLNATFNTVPAFGAPPAFTPTRTYAQNNTAAFTNFGTVFAIDPNLKVQQNYEYNFGYQREIGFNTAIEIRYVGGFSNNLVRAIDYNQIDIRKNGFLDDFIRAQNNCRLQGGAGGLATCTDGRYNANIVGSQQTPVFNQLVSQGFLNDPTVVTALRNGTPADIALTYITNNLDNGIFLANPNTGVADLLGNYGKYRYNSLQAEIRRRFTGGLSFQANYTFQKILTNVAADQQTRFDPYTDNANQALEYARPDYDRTHSVNINWIYELPFGKGKQFFNQGGWLNRLVGGFQFNSLMNISSGEPTSILDNRGVINRAARSARQAANSSLTTDQIQDLVGIYRTPNGVFLIDPRVLYAVATSSVAGQLPINGFDLTQPLPAGYTITSIRGANAYGSAPFAGQVFFPLEPGKAGNLSRAFINGPMYFNWDASIIKNIAVTETTRIQLRMEVFNVLNTANFFIGENSGVFNVNGTNFGRITQTYPPRIVQFGARFEF